MQVHKVVLSIVDFDQVGSENIKRVLENLHYPNRCISPTIESLETKDIGEWDDDHPMNYSLTSHEYFKKLFK